MNRSENDIPSAVDKEEFAEMLIQKEHFELFIKLAAEHQNSHLYCLHNISKRAWTLINWFFFFKEKLNPSRKKNNGKSHDSDIWTHRNHGGFLRRRVDITVAEFDRTEGQE